MLWLLLYTIYFYFAKKSYIMIQICDECEMRCCKIEEGTTTKRVIKSVGALSAMSCRKKWVFFGVLWHPKSSDNDFNWVNACTMCDGSKVMGDTKKNIKTYIISSKEKVVGGRNGS